MLLSDHQKKIAEDIAYHVIWNKDFNIVLWVKNSEFRREFHEEVLSHIPAHMIEEKRAKSISLTFGSRVFFATLNDSMKGMTINRAYFPETLSGRDAELNELIQGVSPAMYAFRGTTLKYEAE